MGRRKLTPVEKAQRMLRRDNARQEKAEKVGRIETWLQQRAAAAEERKRDAREERETYESPGATRAREARQRHEQKQPAPRTLPPSVGVVNFPDTTLGTFQGQAGNYADRRAWGQRGKQRPRRAREMPGAQERRIERNRQAWLS